MIQWDLGYQNQLDCLGCVQRKRKNFLYLDSGCLGHMTGDKSMFIRFEERAGPGVTFGDDSNDYTTRYDLISKENVIMEPVALFDRLKHNLLSTSQLCDSENNM